MRTFYAVIACVLTAVACTDTSASRTLSNSYVGIQYYTDLRTVPIDKSNLAPGPQVLTFRATAFEAGVGTVAWDDARRALVKAEISAAKGGPDPQFVPAEVVFKDVPGHASEQEVSVTVNLDGPGTWQVDLPRPCYDFAAMGFNGPDLKQIPPTPAGAQRPDALGCVATAVLTVGACPHVVYSEMVSGGKGKGTDVWRVLWSEPIAGKVAQSPKFESWHGAGPTAKKVLDGPTVAYEKDSSYTLTVNKGDAVQYEHFWAFDADDKVPGKFFTGTAGQLFDCSVSAGNALVARTDSHGDPDAGSMMRVSPHAMAQIIEAKKQPAKTLPDGTN